MPKLQLLNTNSILDMHVNTPAKQKLSVVLRANRRASRNLQVGTSALTSMIENGNGHDTFSHSIDEQLHALALGTKLKRLRLSKGLALVQVGQLSGLSSSMLCKLERGRALPTLPTLLRISHALSVDLHYFFHDPHRVSLSIVRRTERLRFRNVPNTSYSYAFESLNFRARKKYFNAYWAEFQPVPDKVHSHQHKGDEFLYVLEGELAIRIGAEEHRLEAGDAIYFESDIPHSYRRVGIDPCRALVVVSLSDENDQSEVSPADIARH